MEYNLIKQIPSQDEYFLVTPVEKIKITVDDAPFVLTQWHWQDENKATMIVSNNVGNEFVLDTKHPKIRF